jgi:hypothetical protein
MGLSRSIVLLGGLVSMLVRAEVVVHFACLFVWCVDCPCALLNDGHSFFAIPCFLSKNIKLHENKKCIHS